MKPREFILDVVSGEFYDIEWDGDLADGKYVLRQILPETTDVVPEFPTAEYRLWENAHLLLPNSSLYPGDAARWAWSARGKAACKPDKPEAAESVEAGGNCIERIETQSGLYWHG